MLIVHSTPSGWNKCLTFAPGRLRLITLLPNPCLVGAETSTPHSRQRNHSSPLSNRHSIRTFPSQFNRQDPYFTAFVANSCNSKAKEVVESGGSFTGGPATSTQTGLGHMGSMIASISPRKSEPSVEVIDKKS